MKAEMDQIPKNGFRLLNVIGDDMCIACGACVFACPQGAIEPVFNKRRAVFEVKINRLDSCHNCTNCDEVCPSIDVNIPDLLKPSSETQPVEKTGPLESIEIGYAHAYQFDGVSSSGGIIRALIGDALQQNKPVICLGKKQDNYGAVLVETIADIQKIPGSIYHSISFTDAIRLLKEIDRPCVLVAIPCHLEGIKNYILKFEPALMNKIDLTIGLICGWMYSHHAIYAFAHYKGIKDPIIDAGYRGEDKVGALKLFTAKTKHAYSRRIFQNVKEWIDYRSSFSRTLNRLRCRVCEDHVNVLADIAVGDAWLKAYQGKKMSIILVRNRNGARALRSLEQNGKVVLEKGSVEDIIESQSENLVYGHSARLMNAYLTQKDMITPKFYFGEAGTRENLKFYHQLNFAYELLMRKTIQKSRYTFYRFSFIFYKWPLIIKFFLHKLTKRSSRSQGAK